MMVALASNGVRLMPSMPSTMAPATTKTKKRQMLATTPDMVATRAPALRRARAVRRLVGDTLEDPADHPGAQPGHDQGDDDDDQDARAAARSGRSPSTRCPGLTPDLIRRW